MLTWGLGAFAGDYPINAAGKLAPAGNFILTSKE
jgi:hypothetical protein